MELCDPFGWHLLDAARVLDIRLKLCQFETMTWGEILVAGGQRNHLISFEQLVPAAQQRLRSIGQGDLAEVLSLRLAAKERVWGILREGVLHLLWWDPDHAICPSPLRNT
jgi:hypothetical protein